MEHPAASVRILPQFLYLEPTSVCNLHCTMCYTNVINGKERRVLDKHHVLDFVRRFVAATEPPASIYWCGTGEVLLHPEFPEMVNTLLAEFGSSLGQIIQTNGTVPKRLREFASLEALDFRVSIDGPLAAHEQMRGKNTYERTIRFCREVMDRGCKSLTVRTLLTRENIDELDVFHAELIERVGPAVKLQIGIGYTNRTLVQLRRRALAVVQHDIADGNLIGEAEARQILSTRYQDRYSLDEHVEPNTASVVDNYLSLNTYGVFSCCHGIIKLGDVESDIAALRTRMIKTEGACRSCAMFPCM